MNKANAFAATLAALLVAACNNTPRSETRTGSAQPQAQQTSAVDDALIVTTIQAKYYGSAEVKGRDINVDSENGLVTLRGKVDTETAKQQAVALAKSTTGVSRVDDQLTLATDAERTMARSSQPDSHSPGWITTKIQAQYYMHPGLKPWNIDVVTTPDGVVTLVGAVDSAADRAEAVKIARGTEGVTGLTDNLRVRGETAGTTGTTDRMAAITDSWITSKIQSRYFVDDDVKGRNINVDTSNGVVRLRGTVHSNGERLQAAAIARNTDGVREVHDELMIDAKPRRTADAPSGVSGSVGIVGQKIEDSWITTKIQSKFFLDDRIRARQIDVDTKNGVVTLKGTVADEAAKKAAEDLAMESDGVVRVVNQLRIDPNTA